MVALTSSPWRAIPRETFLFVVLVWLLARATPAQTITEFPLPSSACPPRSIVAGPDGALWFTEPLCGKIGRITTVGTITEFSVPGLPGAITSGPDGNLWFTEPLGGLGIGRITTAGVVTDFPIPRASSLPWGIAAGGDGNLWFTQFTSRIGRISTDGQSTEFVIPTPDSDPTGIVSGPDGALWFVERYSSKIGRITTGGVIQEFRIPENHLSGGIAVGPDDNLWFTETFGIGRLTPGGELTEFPTDGNPREIAAGPDGTMWFTGAGATIESVGRITTAGFVTEFQLPTMFAGAGSITPGPDGALWFTEASKIGRITAGCSPNPKSLCLGGGRFRVEAAWRVPSQGTSGLGTGVSLTADTGYFWFFSSSNVETVVKVVDGCAFNGRHWVFAGGLTNVEVTLTVTDTFTGAVKRYVNPADTAFLPIQDTAAFEGCPSALEPELGTCSNGRFP